MSEKVFPQHEPTALAGLIQLRVLTWQGTVTGAGMLIDTRRFDWQE
jgi:hypothetical protein